MFTEILVLDRVKHHEFKMNKSQIPIKLVVLVALTLLAQRRDKNTVEELPFTPRFTYDTIFIIFSENCDQLFQDVFVSQGPTMFREVLILIIKWDLTAALGLSIVLMLRGTYIMRGGRPLVLAERSGPPWHFRSRQELYLWQQVGAATDKTILGSVSKLIGLKRGAIKDVDFVHYDRHDREFLVNDGHRIADGAFHMKHRLFCYI